MLSEVYSSGIRTLDGIKTQYQEDYILSYMETNKMKKVYKNNNKLLNGTPMYIGVPLYL